MEHLGIWSILVRAVFLINKKIADHFLDVPLFFPQPYILAWKFSWLAGPCKRKLDGLVLSKGLQVVTRNHPESHKTTQQLAFWANLLFGKKKTWQWKSLIFIDMFNFSMVFLKCLHLHKLIPRFPTFFMAPNIGSLFHRRPQGGAPQTRPPQDWRHMPQMWAPEELPKRQRLSGQTSRYHKKAAFYNSNTWGLLMFIVDIHLDMFNDWFIVYIHIYIYMSNDTSCSCYGI